MMFNLILRQFLSCRTWQAPMLGIILWLSYADAGLKTFAQPTPPAAATSSSGVNPAFRETEYTLGTGDVIRIAVFQVEEFSGEHLVLVDGTVTFPLIGRLRVEGLTLPQLSNLLSQRYSPYLKRPIITVNLINPRPLKVAIAGEVNSPGAYLVNPTPKFPGVTDLIQLAGGLTTAADVSQVQVRRFFQGKQQIVQLNLWALLQQGDQTQNISLRDGDTIYIPTQEQINLAQTRQLADANFGIKATSAINVAVVGEVYRPGSYQLSSTNPTTTGSNPVNQPLQLPRLTQALQQAGGIKPLANVRQIEVRRFTSSGEQQTLSVDLWQLLQTGKIEEDVILQNGDTIIIPTAAALSPSESETLATTSFSPAAIRVNVAGEVKRPGIIEVPPNTPLNQAILAAGGFDERRADTDTVELIRINPNGTVSKRQINIDFAQGIGEENNPTLRNNDVVVVSRSGLAAVTDTLSTIVSPIGSALGLLNVLNLFQ